MGGKAAFPVDLPYVSSKVTADGSAVVYMVPPCTGVSSRNVDKKV